MNKNTYATATGIRNGTCLCNLKRKSLKACSFCGGDRKIDYLITVPIVPIDLRYGEKDRVLILHSLITRMAFTDIYYTLEEAVDITFKNFLKGDPIGVARVIPVKETKLDVEKES